MLADFGGDYFYVPTLKGAIYSWDLFGPAGASLAKGMPFSPIGPRRANWLRIERKAPSAGKRKASGERLVTVGSTDRIEIAINEGDLAGTLGIGAGQIVTQVPAGTVESGAGRGMGARLSSCHPPVAFLN